MSFSVDIFAVGLVYNGIDEGLSVVVGVLARNEDNSTLYVRTALNLSPKTALIPTFQSYLKDLWFTLI